MCPMNPVDEMTMETETTRAETPEGAEIICPYATRSWGELLKMELPTAEEIWGNFTLGENGSMFGPPGIGKSRISLNTARNQVLSMPFGGLPTCPRPLRHLLMGSENSIRRLKNDIERMNAGLSVEQTALLSDHIELATLEGPEDSYISVASPVNVERWRATLNAFKPEVLWVDPWGDVLDGDANADDDARTTHSILSRLLRKATSGDSSMIVMAHSRMGAKNYMMATGYDSGNYGKGSKALQAISRCYWNIAPGDETDTPPVLLFNKKASNGLPYKPIALRLDSETMLYHPDPDFDFDAWQEEVNARANGKGKTRRKPRLSEDAAFDALGDTAVSKTEAKQILQDAGCTRDEADDLCKRLLVSRKWTDYRPPFKNPPTYIGPPAAVARRKAEILESAQGKIQL
jgi:hypothetical protein